MLQPRQESRECIVHLWPFQRGPEALVVPQRGPEALDDGPEGHRHSGSRRVHEPAAVGALPRRSRRAGNARCRHPQCHAPRYSPRRQCRGRSHAAQQESRRIHRESAPGIRGAADRRKRAAGAGVPRDEGAAAPRGALQRAQQLHDDLRCVQRSREKGRGELRLLARIDPAVRSQRGPDPAARPALGGRKRTDPPARRLLAADRRRHSRTRRQQRQHAERSERAGRSRLHAERVVDGSALGAVRADLRGRRSEPRPLDHQRRGHARVRIRRRRM